LSGPSPDTDRIADYLEAAQKFAEGRVRYARAWQMAYFRTKDSFAANQIATEQTKDELTILKALYKIAEERMVRE
jgi:hypothetical protein